MKINKFILISVLVLLVIPIISAESAYIFAKEENITLCIPVFNSDNSEADASTGCYLTLKDSKMNLLLDDLIMYINGTGSFCIDINDSFDLVGKYPTSMRCDDGADYAFSSFTIEITPSGTKLSTAQGIMYIIFLVVAFFIFWISIYGSFKIPWRNIRDDSGKVVSVNDLKWLKLFLMVFSYSTFMFIMVMTYNITENFIYIGNVSNYFYYVYLFSLTLFFPIMILLPWVVIYVVFQDKKVKKLLQRGIPMR